MELKFYFELLEKVDEMSFSNHDDKKAVRVHHPQDY